MKKVEVYFIINLAAILSIFAIEGELGVYMRRQNDILLEVARDKIDLMIEVDNISSIHSELLYKFAFELSGEYRKNSIAVDATYTLNDTSLKNTDYVVKSKAILKDGSYVSEFPLSRFNTYQDKKFDVALNIKFEPDISNETMNKWSKIFGSEKIAKKIKDNISDKVKREGSFTIKRTLDSPITPIPMEGQKTDFFVLFDKKRYTVLKGLDWEIPVTIGGVFSNNDFTISIITGADMITSFDQGTPRSIIKGSATNKGGVIEISGIRNKDSKAVLAKTRIVTINPSWANSQELNEIYTNEEYDFDFRIKSLSRDRVSIKLSSSYDKHNKVIENSSITVGPFKKKGLLIFQTLIDGKPLKALAYTVKVKQLPEPEVGFKRKPDTNQLTLEVITYGKLNSVDKLFPIGGISGKIVEISGEKFGNRKITRYRLGISRPAYGEYQSVKLKIKDKYGTLKEYENEFEYIK